MKVFLFTVLLAFWAMIGVLAQATSDLVVFSEQGHKFWLVVNGIKQNNQAQANVQVRGLKVGGYQLKAIFEDQKPGSVDKFVALDLYPEQEMTLGLKQVEKKKKVSDSKGKSVTKTIKVWKMQVISINPVKKTAPANYSGNQPARQESSVQLTTPKAEIPKPASPSPQASASGQVVITMPFVTIDANGNVTMNMGNMAVPISAMNSNYKCESRQCNLQQAAIKQQMHADPCPAAVGLAGCCTAMNEADFANAKNSVQKQSFEDAKLKVMRQIIAGNCITTEQTRSLMQMLTYENSKLDFARQAVHRTVDQSAAQVKAIMKDFTYEDSRLQFAKYAYATTRDKSNYYQVNDGFTYSGSIDELNKFIAAQPR